MTSNVAREVRVCSLAVALATLLSGAFGCDGSAAQQSASLPTEVSVTVARPLTAADKTHAARASFYAARIARYRAAAAAQRQRVAAYEARATRAGAASRTEGIEKLKAAHESHAVAAEQIAARIQPLADYHTTEASKEVGR